MAVLLSVVFACAVGLAFLLGTLVGHDEEHKGCRHGRH